MGAAKTTSGGNDAGVPTSVKVLLWAVVIQTVLLLCPQPKIDPLHDVALPLARSYVASTVTAAGDATRDATDHDASVASIPVNDKRPLEGRNVLITGPTAGIGQGLAEILSQMGATIIAVGRSQSKLERLKDTLDGPVDTFVADMADLQQVATATEQILQSEYDRIDFVIANAGLHYGWTTFGSPATAQGVDLVYGVNYLAHFLMIEKLRPMLKQQKQPAKVVFINSFYHFAVNAQDIASVASSDPPNWIFADTLCPRPMYRDQYMYGASKVSLMLYAQYLQRTASLNLSIVSADPGWTGTNISGRKGALLHLPQQWLGFAVHDGWGLVSILHAIFDVDRHTFWSNARNYRALPMFLNQESRLLPIIRSLFRLLRVRDAYTFVMGFLLGYTQRFCYDAYPLDPAIETADTDIQNNVVEWSRAFVSQWL